MPKLRVIFIQSILSSLSTIVALSSTEMIYRGGPASFLRWMWQYPSNAVYLFFLLFLFFLSLLLFNYKGFFIGTVLTILLFSFLAFAGFTKEKLRGDPILPADIEMAGEAKNMLQFFSKLSSTTILIILLVIIAILGTIVFFYRRIENHKGTRLFYFPSAFALVLLMVFLSQDLFITDGFLKKSFSVHINNNNQKQNYQENGVLLSFLRNTPSVSAERPDQYSSNEMKAITDKLDRQKGKKIVDKDKPNIIIVMSEAFWDPTVMNNVQFNKDPLPNFHKLTKGYSSGTVFTPVYGGSTSNTEFEVLTGMTNQFLPAGSVPYKSFIKKPLPSLPNILRSQGYETTAIHIYHNWFYDRNVIYRLLGFNQFVSLEFFPKPVNDMMYYRDNEVTDEILKQLHASDKPNFIFAVTMQNHGPYRTDAKKFYATMHAKNKGRAFSPSGKNILEFYADNLVEIDKELLKLVSNLEKSKEKTIVVYFGDHLPLLGENYQVYRESGYFYDDQKYKDYLKMYQTPLLVWNNFGAKREELHLSSSFIGPYVLNMAGLQGYYLTDFLTKLQSEGKSFLPRRDYLKYSSLAPKDLQTYKHLQYDLLFGKGYGLQNEADLDIEPSKNYRLGIADPHITRYEVASFRGRKAVLLKGDYLTSSCRVYINGVATDSTFINENTVYAYIPKGVEPKSIQMKIFDNKETLLAASNKVEID
ncbi:MAG: LTA synthase family protein [Bacillota bacterium]|nr:LTA synthase family protein [Bacillota bacterium]